jgi:alkylation response protein AidB-like acyl-CoA dehydrogenase
MLNPALAGWLEQHAEALNAGEADVSLALLQQLGQADVFRHGVPEAFGGLGDSLQDAIETIAQVAEYSVTAAFVSWSQRTYIEYLLTAKADCLAEFRFQDLLAGTYAGATGLSNAMKFLSGLEPLQIQAQAVEGGWQLNGKLPWVTNFHPEGFSVAVAADSDQGPLLFLVPSDRAGFDRRPNLELIGLKGSSTAAANLTDVHVTQTELLSGQAKQYLPAIRPAFLGLQCALSIGLIRRSVQQVVAKKHSDLVDDEVDAIQQQLNEHLNALFAGLASGQFVTQARALFEIRIGLSELTQQAIQLELCSTGGKCYLTPFEDGFTRRLKESAFIPIVTPSVLQLKTELSRLSA